MSARYISRKFGESRSVSRAQSAAPESSWSRASSQMPEFGSGFSSRATTPGLDDRPWSSASTYNHYSNYSSPGFHKQNQKQTRDWTAELIPMERSSRGVTPVVNGYTDALIKSSRRLRERSLSPTRSHVVTVRPVSQYKTNQDYYRGKVKSIYEREPMFAEFVRNLPLTDLHANSSTDLRRLKRSFQYMIEDRWGRKQCNDPSAPHDTAIKTTPWANYLSRPEPASVVLAEKHRYRGKTPVAMPRITVYHRSTLK